MTELLAERTGLEPATSCVTGRHSNQLNYRSVLFYFLKWARTATFPSYSGQGF